MLAVLATMSTVDHLKLWLDTPQAALIPAVDIPKWVVFMVVPYSFFAVAVRFIGYATRLLPLPPPEPEFEMEEPQ
jgi:TRAP-type C4-dicarboxylate transport system permease small subunit